MFRWSVIVLVNGPVKPCLSEHVGTEGSSGKENIGIDEVSSWDSSTINGVSRKILFYDYQNSSKSVEKYLLNIFVTNDITNNYRPLKPRSLLPEFRLNGL